MKNKYRVTYVAESELMEEVVMAESIMAGAQNGVLVAFDYEPSADPQVPPQPRMVRMFAAGVWRTVDNEGVFIQVVKGDKDG